MAKKAASFPWGLVALVGVLVAGIAAVAVFGVRVLNQRPGGGAASGDGSLALSSSKGEAPPGAAKAIESSLPSPAPAQTGPARAVPPSPLPGDPKQLESMTSDLLRVGTATSGIETVWAMAQAANGRRLELSSAVRQKRLEFVEELGTAYGLILEEGLLPVLLEGEALASSLESKKEVARTELASNEELLSQTEAELSGKAKAAVHDALLTTRAVMLQAAAKTPELSLGSSDVREPRHDLGPGRPGYVLKLSHELVGLGLTAEAGAKVSLFLKSASERLTELKALGGPGAAALATALVRSHARLMTEGALGVVTAYAEEGVPMTSSVKAYQEAALRQAAVLGPLLETAPPEEKEALERALEVCRRAPDDSALALSRAQAKAEKRSSARRRMREASEAYAKQYKSSSSAPGAPSKRATISTGEAYSSADYKYPGYITVLDFYADWCGPCRRVGPYIEDLVGRYDKVVLRKVNIVSWDSAAWRQTAGEHGAHAIPFVCVIDGNGNVAGRFMGAEIASVEPLLRSLSTR